MMVKIWQNFSVLPNFNLLKKGDVYLLIEKIH